MKHCQFCCEQVLEASGFDKNEIEAAQAYCKNGRAKVGQHFNPETFRVAYCGRFNTHEDFICQYVEPLIPHKAGTVISIDLLPSWRNLRRVYSEYDCHYFRNGKEVSDPKEEAECDACCELRVLFDSGVGAMVCWYCLPTPADLPTT